MKERSKPKQQQTKQNNMAINFKKGAGLSLRQSDKVAAASGTIVAGQVVRITAGGAIAGASASPAPSTDLLGFAINNSTDGDVIASGNIGVALLDGGLVVETDQVALTINASNYPLGTKLTAGTDGKVAAAGSSDRVIGQVEGIRLLPNTAAGSVIGTTTAFLGIKVQD